jgi:hypothetical protein
MFRSDVPGEWYREVEFSVWKAKWCLRLVLRCECRRPTRIRYCQKKALCNKDVSGREACDLCRRHSRRSIVGGQPAGPKGQ